MTDKKRDREPALADQQIAQQPKQRAAQGQGSAGSQKAPPPHQPSPIKG